MKIKVITKEKNKLVVKLHGTTHTFCNALRDELWNVKGVVVSTYNQDHPEIGIPKLFLETKGTDPIKALNEAADNLLSKNEEFEKLSVKALG